MRTNQLTTELMKHSYAANLIVKMIGGRKHHHLIITLDTEKHNPGKNKKKSLKEKLILLQKHPLTIILIYKKTITNINMNQFLSLHDKSFTFNGITEQE